LQVHRKILCRSCHITGTGTGNATPTSERFIIGRQGNRLLARSQNIALCFNSTEQPTVEAESILIVGLRWIKFNRFLYII
jgi:hypothetical protein